MATIETVYQKGDDKEIRYPFERDLPANFREPWVDRAEIAERALLCRGRLVKRVHWDTWGPTGIVYPGPIFDWTRMADSIIQRMTGANAVGFSWATLEQMQTRTPTTATPGENLYTDNSYETLNGIVFNGKPKASVYRGFQIYQRRAGLPLDDFPEPLTR